MARPKKVEEKTPDKENVIGTPTKVPRSFKPYYVNVTGQFISTISGSRPEDTSFLINKPDKAVTDELYKIMKAQVDLCLQTGDIAGATKVVNDYQNIEHPYRNPLSVFQKDQQCQNRPYQGAYMYFGAIRDTIKLAYPKEFNIYVKGKNAGGPSIKHIRKSILVRPNHIFLFKDDGTYIEQEDIEIENQHPCGDVKGFSRFEIVKYNANVKFRVEVHSCTQFPALANKELFEKVIIQSALHGIGSRRSAGYGQWKVTSTSIHDMGKLEEPNEETKAIRKIA